MVPFHIPSLPKQALSISLRLQPAIPTISNGRIHSTASIIGEWEANITANCFITGPPWR